VHHFHDHYGGAGSGLAPTPAPTDVCASDKCAPGCPCKNAAYELKHFPKTASPLPAGCPKCPTTAEEVLLQDDHYVVPEPTTHYYTPPPMTHPHVETGSAEHVHDVHFHGFSTGSGDDHHFHGAGSGFTPTPAPTDVCASDKCAAGCPCKNAAWMAKFDAQHHPNAPATPLPAGCPKCDVSLQDVPASFLVNRPKLLGKLKASLLGESTKNYSYYSPTPSYYSPSPSYYSPSPSYYSPSPSYVHHDYGNGTNSANGTDVDVSICVSYSGGTDFQFFVRGQTQHRVQVQCSSPSGKCCAGGGTWNFKKTRKEAKSGTLNAADSSVTCRLLGTTPEVSYTATPGGPDVYSCGNQTKASQ